MREIRFRAWDKNLKEMLTMDNPTYSAGSDFDPHICDLQWFFSSLQSEGSMFTDENKRYVLMQYTGLKDSKGVEIYEGDIVLRCFDIGDPDYGLVHLVVFYQGSFGYIFDEDENSKIFKDFELLKLKEEVHVIGNIYENPELF